MSLRPSGSSSPPISCLRTKVFGLRSSNSKSLNSGPSSLRMSSFAVSAKDRTFRMNPMVSWISFGSLSGPKITMAMMARVRTSSVPTSLNTKAPYGRERIGQTLPTA